MWTLLVLFIKPLVLLFWISGNSLTNETESPLIKWRAKLTGFSDWLFRFLQTPLDWLSYNTYIFVDTNLKLNEINKKKREDRALILIATILKFSARLSLD